MNRLLEKIKKKIWKKKREKLLEEKIKDLEAKLLEADVELSGFEVYHSKLAYRLVREAFRLEKRRRKEARSYVV